MMHNCIHITIPVNKSIVPVPELSANPSAAVKCESITIDVIGWLLQINACSVTSFELGATRL
jgi:hypothetical protein